MVRGLPFPWLTHQVPTAEVGLERKVTAKNLLQVHNMCVLEPNHMSQLMCPRVCIKGKLELEAGNSDLDCGCFNWWFNF